MSTLTSRSRVMAALRCEEPDRVPFLESVIDAGVAMERIRSTEQPGVPRKALKDAGL